jgi:predicted phage tail protein
MSDTVVQSANPNLTTIHLEGALGAKFGRIWRLDVKSTAEAIRAIDINLRGALQQYLGGPARNKWYKIALQKKTNVIDPKEVRHRSGRSDIWIIPTVRGAGKGMGKILAGVALLALVYFTGGFAAGATGWATGSTAGTLGFFGQLAVGFGISLILGGIVQAMTPSPSTPPDNKNSNVFAGSTAPTVQGVCVPVVYGRALVSPVVVGVGLDNNEMSTSAPIGAIGGVYTDGINGNQGGGGVFQYVVTIENQDPYPDPTQPTGPG